MRQPYYHRKFGVPRHWFIIVLVVLSCQWLPGNRGVLGLVRIYLNTTMKEELPKGTSVKSLDKLPEFKTAQANNLKFYMISKNKFFNVTSNGSLYTKIKYDRDEICPGCTKFSEKVMVRVDNREVTSIKSYVIFLTIKIIDIDDNEPSFQSLNNEAHLVRIKENQNTDHKYVLPVATDNDSPKYSNFQYELRDNYLRPLNSYIKEFQLIHKEYDLDIGDGTGIMVELQPKKRFNREEQSVYRMHLVVIDLEDSKKVKTYKKIRVEILDVNDNVPTFSDTTFYGSVLESAMKKHEIQMKNKQNKNVTLLATDMDENAQIDYKLYSGSMICPSVKCPFYMDAHKLRVDQKVDYERTQRYDLIVKADDGSFSSRADIKITILNANDNPLVIDFYISPIHVTENLLPSTAISFVTVTDADNKDNVKPVNCHLDNAPYFFTLKNGTSMNMFEIFLMKPLDREQKSYYNITLNCVADTGDSSYKTLKVIVNDVNDNDPIIDGDFTVTVKENQPASTHLVTLKARDIDENPNFYFRVIKGGEYVSISTFTGVLKTEKPLDREALGPFIRVEVELRDSGISQNTRTVTKEITINIEDVNDEKLHFLSDSYTFNVSEYNNRADVELSGERGVVSHRRVGVVNARDLDVTVEFSDFSYKASKEAHNLGFRVNKMSGEITSSLKFDRENVANYTFLVLAEQKLHGHVMASVVQCKVLVLITDVDDNQPMWVFPVQQESNSTSEVQVSSMTPIGGHVTTVIAFDPDTSSVLSYSILKVLAWRIFSVDASTGRITTNQAFPVQLNKYAISIQVTDGVHDPSVVTLNVISNPRVALSSENTHRQADVSVGLRRNLWIAVAVAVVSTLVVLALLAAIGVERRRQIARKRSDHRQTEMIGSQPLKTISKLDRYRDHEEDYMQSKTFNTQGDNLMTIEDDGNSIGSGDSGRGASEEGVSKQAKHTMNTFRPVVGGEPRMYQRHPTTLSRPVSYVDYTPPRTLTHASSCEPETHATSPRPSPSRRASPTRPSSRPPPRPLSMAMELHSSQTSVQSGSVNRTPVKRTIRQILV